MSDPKHSAVQALHVMMFAGPNGSGKTSLIDDIKQTGLPRCAAATPFLSASSILTRLPRTCAAAFWTRIRGMRQRRQRRSQRVQKRSSKMSFTFKTVMSYPSRINEMLLLKEQGYHLFLVLITTDNPEKNVD
jgi:predicted ABC-type ATPase